MRMYCSNRAGVRIKKADYFLQNLGCCHRVLVAGSYAKAIYDEMLGMNVRIVGPSDLSASEIGTAWSSIQLL
jgi:hypothetical protein